MTEMSDNQSIEAILLVCNFELARDEIAKFFRMANEDATRKGGSMIYKAAFVDGWQKFSATPNASTARAWLNLTFATGPCFCPVSAAAQA